MLSQHTRQQILEQLKIMELGHNAIRESVGKLLNATSKGGKVSFRDFMS